MLPTARFVLGADVLAIGCPLAIGAPSVQAQAPSVQAQVPRYYTPAPVYSCHSGNLGRLAPPASPDADRVEPGALSQVHQKDMFDEYVMAYEVMQLARRGERRSHFRHGPPQPIVSP